MQSARDVLRQSVIDGQPIVAQHDAIRTGRAEAKALSHKPDVLPEQDAIRMGRAEAKLLLLRQKE